jgi:methylglutaconyl-CoA hydratase
VHAVVGGDELDTAVAAYLKEILAAGPEAIAEAKALIGSLWNLSVDEAAPIASAAIARRRVSAEGQEGLRAFSEKRKPTWSA